MYKWGALMGATTNLSKWKAPAINVGRLETANGNQPTTRPAFPTPLKRPMDH